MLRMFLFSRVSVVLVMGALAVSLLLIGSATSASVHASRQIELALKGVEYHAYFTLSVSELGDLKLLLASLEAVRCLKPVEKVGLVASLPLCRGPSVNVTLIAGNITWSPEPDIEGVLGLLVLDNETADRLGLEPGYLYLSTSMEGALGLPKATLNISWDGVSWSSRLRVIHLNKVEELLGRLTSRRTGMVSGGSVVMIMPPYISSDLVVVGRLSDLLSSSLSTTLLRLEDEGVLRLREVDVVSVTLLVRFHRDEFLVPYSIDASIERLGKLCDAVEESVRSVGVEVRGREDVGGLLSSMKFIETMMHFGLVFSQVPSLIVVWLVSRRVPEILVVRLRRLIALLKVRGVPSKSLSRGLMLSVACWSAAGALLGVPLGVVTALLVMGEPVSLDVLRFVDLQSIAIYVAIALIIPLFASWRASGALKRVEPREVVRASRLEEELVELRPGKGSLIALILGSYYVAKSLAGFSPVKILAELGPGAPIVLIIVLVILVIIDGFLSFFGPILFVYGVSSYLTISPKALRKVIGVFSRMAGELKLVVERLAEQKPARIALLVMIVSFSLGMSSAGVVGYDTVKGLLDEGYRVAAGSRVVAAKPLDDVPLSELKLEISELRSDLDPLGCAYTTWLIVRDLHYVSTGPEEAWARVSFISESGEEIPYSGIMLVDPDVLLDAIWASRGLGIDRPLDDIVRELRGGVAIVASEPLVPAGSPVRLSLVYYTTEPPYQRALGEVELTYAGTLRNVPGSYSMYVLDRERGGRLGLNWEYAFSVSGILPYGFCYAKPMGLAVSSLSLLDEIEEFSGEGEIKVSGSLLVLVNADPELVKDKLEAEGFKLVTYDELYADRFSSTIEVLTLNYKASFEGGIALLIASIVGVAAMSYTMITENITTYTMMRIRGAPLRRVMAVVVSEIAAVILVSSAVGLLLGVASGYGSALTGLSTPMGPIGGSILDYYGVAVRPIVTLHSLGVVLALILAVLGLSVGIGLAAYRGSAREALRLMRV